MRKNNLILRADSYKYSHYLQYPRDANAMMSYIEARHNNSPYQQYEIYSTVFFGLQMFVKEYLLTPITMEDVDFAEKVITAHGEPFNRKGWEKVVKEYGGYLPVTIKAPKEGSRIPLSNVLVTVQSDDPDLFWLASFIETALERAIWYPTTVATISRLCKDIIGKYLRMTCDDPASQLPFKLHDFGARGATSSESAAIGGLAHLVNFKGTDTVEALVYGMDYYNCPMAGFSIPAAEHSTITAWGIEFEQQAYENMVDEFAKPGAVYACVSDSYDIFNAAEKLWGEELREKVINSGATLVVRPDSGDPVQVTDKLIEILGEKFGYAVNKKGFKVLNTVRIIQGDGVNPYCIDKILKNFMVKGWSAENIAFGMGGALLQKVDRDTFSFAMKCSAIRRGGLWQDVYKDPVTGSGKRSKRGKLTLVIDGEFPSGPVYKTLRESEIGRGRIILETVYENGKLLREQSLDEIREIADA